MGGTFSSNPYADDNSYAANKNILITGASAGIGAELARQFARQGANLALVARNQERLDALAEECRYELGAKNVKLFKCDLTEDEDIRKAIRNAVDTFGHFDIVVLNAGRSMGCYFEEIKDMASINYMLKLNINGVINALMCALPAIPKSEASRIVVVSSVCGLVPVPYRTVYCASKHALAGFANSLRIELKDTYQDKAPRVQLINFPEVQGTDLNNGRMTMGAVRPPAEFQTPPKMMTVQQACAGLVAAIEAGTDEWGQSFVLNTILALRLFAANLADSIVLKKVKRTHTRPDEGNGSDSDNGNNNAPIDETSGKNKKSQ